MKRLALTGALSAALVYFLDPQNGARRRKTTRDRLLGTLRRRRRQLARTGRGIGAEAYGVSQRLQHLREEPKDYDDATLARKVETVIFRDADAPKGTVNVNAQNGIVQLRGQVDTPRQIEQLAAKARKVQGVRDVENLLHLPGTPAPMHQ